MDPIPPRYSVLGVDINALDLATARRLIAQAAAEKRRGYVAFAVVSTVVAAQDDASLRAALNGSFLTTPDGMPLVWLGKRRGGPHVDRAYGPDALLAVCEDSLKSGASHFFFGGAEGVAEELADRLKKRFPGLNVVGTFTPPFRPLNEDEEVALVEQVAAVKPDFFWVGIGSPRQEKFMADHLGKLDTTVMLGVGAAFDFHSGRKAQAPVWMQRAGLEWLFRLITEPRRLFCRYVFGNARFLWLLMRHWECK
ncbi:MAG: WecB/TagA/CpsF family glycosyltransferase [Puniceicoccales bacterium]